MLTPARNILLSFSNFHLYKRDKKPNKQEVLVQQENQLKNMLHYSYFHLTIIQIHCSLTQQQHQDVFL